MLDHIQEYSKWDSNSTLNSGEDYEYQYTSKDKKYFGIHPIQIQYGDGKRIITDAKFDSGAKTSSISYELGKKIGIPDTLFKIAHELEEEKIDKSFSDEQISNKLKELEKKYPGVIIDKVKSASGFSIRVYFPITLYFDGRIIMTTANIKDRKGMKTEMLVGLEDMI